MLDDAEVLRDLVYFTGQGVLKWKEESTLEYRAMFNDRIGLRLFRSYGWWYLEVSSEDCRNVTLQESKYSSAFRDLINAVIRSESSSALDVLRREIFSSYYAKNRRRE